LRALAALTLLALTPPAAAQTGPSPEEFATARTACTAEVQPHCLFLLATELALANPEGAEGLLNDIAYAQATFGDTAAAERTLTLTTPNFAALAALGRNEEAAAALEAALLKAGFTKGEPEPEKPGDAELREVEKLLRTGQTGNALQTALALDDKLHGPKAKALRLVVDHHLAQADYAAAADVALQIEVDKNDAMARLSVAFGGAYDDYRTNALAAVVGARARSGDLPGARALVNRLAEPRTQISARLELARAAFAAASHDTAKAELDLILATLRTMDDPLLFGTEVLAATADLALQHGESDIARQHAEAAYRIAIRPFIRRAGESRPLQPSRSALLQLATVLQLVGEIEKGQTLYQRGAVPYDKGLFFTQHGDQMTALFVAQVRLGDPKAAETRSKLLAMDGILGKDGRRPLHNAALQLVELGFLQEALLIADELEAVLRRDLLRFEGADPAELYAAILMKDLTLAPEILNASIGARAHFLASLALARSLFAAGQPGEARAVLAALPAEHQHRSAAEPEFLSNPVCASNAIALTQDDLSLTEDAAATRQRGLALATDAAEPVDQARNLLILAASFPDWDSGSLSFGLGCLEYHGSTSETAK
jgi:hypothetical protein